VLPHFGHRRLAAVKPIDLHAWIAELIQAGYSPSTIRTAYRLLALVFEAAVLSDVIGRSPCRGVKLPPMRRAEMRFLDVDEIERLAAAIGPRYRCLVLVGGYGGLRFGEAAGLEVEALDLLRRRLMVTQTLNHVDGKLTVGPPKTAAARRTVTLPAFLADELGAHLGRYGSESNLVFTSSEGTALRRRNFRRRDWLPAVRASVGEPLRFHDLRHTHVALLIAAGEHPKTISSRLGHSTIRTSLDTYGHLFPGMDEAAADRLDAMRSAASVSNLWPNGDAEVVPLNP
jgi:integrase